MHNKSLLLFVIVSLLFSCGGRKNTASPDSVYTKSEQEMLYE